MTGLLIEICELNYTKAGLVFNHTFQVRQGRWECEDSSISLSITWKDCRRTERQRSASQRRLRKYSFQESGSAGDSVARRRSSWFSESTVYRLTMSVIVNPL